MTNNTDQIFIWLKEFKHNWLPQKLSNDIHLLELITTKFQELERLLIENPPNENRVSIEDEYEYHQAELIGNHNDTEQVVVSTQHLSERSIPTPPDIYNQLHDENESFPRPAILIKRISLADAEEFLPSNWKTTKSKRSRKPSKKLLSTINSNAKKPKKNTQTKKLALMSNNDETTNIPRKSTRSSKKNAQHPSTSSLTSIQSTGDDKKKGKRKLRALDAEDDDLYTLGNLSQTDHQNCNHECEQISRYIGQNGILSQTRRINETTNDDDFTIKLHSRKSNKDDKSSTKLSKHSSDGSINTITEPPLVETLAIVEDRGTMDEAQIVKDLIENNDSESLFTSLEITHDKTIETSSIVNNNSIINYNDCIEDISNDGIDPPPSSSSPNLDHSSLTMQR